MCVTLDCLSSPAKNTSGFANMTLIWALSAVWKELRNCLMREDDNLVASSPVVFSVCGLCECVSGVAIAVFISYVCTHFSKHSLKSISVLCFYLIFRFWERKDLFVVVTSISECLSSVTVTYRASSPYCFLLQSLIYLRNFPPRFWRLCSLHF